VNDREISRMEFRLGLLRRRGMSEQEAEAWADRLQERDVDKDDRRLCAECKHLAPMTRCKVGQPAMRAILHRCHRFEWETP